MKKLIWLMTTWVAFGLGMCVGKAFGVSTETIYKHNNDKVVYIHNVAKKHGNICSGAVLNNDGLILTCAHCERDNPKKIFVKFSDDTVVSGTLIKIDLIKDLALIETHHKVRYHFLLGREARIGQRVFSFGSPLGIRNTVTEGIVENIINEDGWLIIHSAFVNPGSSGGPLIDVRGRLIGINRAMLMVNILQAAQGLCVANDLSTIKAFLEE